MRNVNIIHKRVILIVLDGVGIGVLPDANEYGELHANTLLHVCEYLKGPALPNLESIGLGNIISLPNIAPSEQSRSLYGMVSPFTKENDSAPIHWEMMGINNTKKMTLFPSGLPQKIIKKIYNMTGYELVGNTRIDKGSDFESLRELSYQEQKPAVYSTADSVVQIIAHENNISVDIVYSLAKLLREILDEDFYVGRVVAKMFRGTPGNFERVEGKRKDFTVLPPTEDFLLPLLQNENIEVVGIGKISDFFSGIGVSNSIGTKNNLEGINQTVRISKTQNSDFIFVNLLDFDTLGGHNNDPEAFLNLLIEFDYHLPKILKSLGDEDLLIITGDHGNDPTVETKTHTREYCPLIALTYKSQGNRKSLGTRNSFADIGATIAEWYGLSLNFGESFMENLLG